VCRGATSPKAASERSDCGVCPRPGSLVTDPHRRLRVSLAWSSGTTQRVPLSVLRPLPQINHQLHKHSVAEAGRLRTGSALALASAKAPRVPMLTLGQIAPPGKHFPLKFLPPLHASVLLTLIQGNQVFLSKNHQWVLTLEVLVCFVRCLKKETLVFCSSSLELGSRGEEEANVRVFLFAFCLSKVFVSVGHRLMTASCWVSTEQRSRLVFRLWPYLLEVSFKMSRSPRLESLKTETEVCRPIQWRSERTAKWARNCGRRDVRDPMQLLVEPGCLAQVCSLSRCSVWAASAATWVPRWGAANCRGVFVETKPFLDSKLLLTWM